MPNIRRINMQFYFLKLIISLIFLNVLEFFSIVPRKTFIFLLAGNSIEFVFYEVSFYNIFFINE